MGSAPKKFEFERMITAFEAITFSDDSDAALPDTQGFINAMSEVALLFDYLGTGFFFVRQDIESKSEILRTKYIADVKANNSLQDMIELEIETKVIADKKSPSWPSSGRTLLRLMWATKFLHELMKDLHKAYEPGSKLTLKSAVSRAYDVALKENHPWLIQRGVAVAINLLPSKEKFLEVLGVDPAKRDEYLVRVDKTFGPLVAKTYKYYGDHDLLGLP